MIDTPQTVQTSAQLVANIHLVVPRAEIRTVMGPGLAELMAALAAQGIAPTGPWLTRHLKVDPDLFDFEIGVPVAKPPLPVGRVKAGVIPAAKTARTIHRGPYEDLEGAWGQLMAWIAEEGLSPGDGPWEQYLAGPEASPDPAAWRTQLNRPLLG